MNLEVPIVFLVLLSSVSCNPCTIEDSVDITHGLPLSYGEIQHDGNLYKNGEYFIDSVTKRIRGCICLKKTCVNKCCPFGQGYNKAKKLCENVTEVFDPPMYDIYHRLQNERPIHKFVFLFGRRNCTAKGSFRALVTDVMTNPDDDFHMLKSGKLYIERAGQTPNWEERDPDSYCIDTFVSDEGGNKTVVLNALACFQEDEDGTHLTLSSSCMLVSCVFILATVFVYLWLPELHTLHGWVLIAYLLSFFVGFLFMATLQLLIVTNHVNSSICHVLTFIIYFFLLAAFFWLNVMCFDIWWTFSGKRGMHLEKLSTKARFRAYSIYAFGIPTLLTVVMAGLEFSGLPSHPLLPNIRAFGFCFLNGNSKLLWLYVPMVVLCVSNLVFFTLTAVKITIINRQTAMLKSKESGSTHDRHRKDKQRLLLYVKLFALMGINWILEVISALYPKLESVWRFTDAYNVLVGVLIFIIFVCKRKIFRLMKKRYRQSRGDNDLCTQHSSSRTLTISRDDFHMSSVKA